MLLPCIARQELQHNSPSCMQMHGHVHCVRTYVHAQEINMLRVRLGQSGTRAPCMSRCCICRDASPPLPYAQSDKREMVRETKKTRRHVQCLTNY